MCPFAEVLDVVIRKTFGELSKQSNFLVSEELEDFENDEA